MRAEMITFITLFPLRFDHINAVKEELQKLFVDEEEAVIQLALESSDFDLVKAQLILSASQERDESFSTVKNLTLRYIQLIFIVEFP
jgi:hypothetical protein